MQSIFQEPMINTLQQGLANFLVTGLSSSCKGHDLIHGSDDGETYQ